MRHQRGWTYQDGIDNVKSECDLDQYENWDFQISNDGRDDIEQFLKKLVNVIHDEILQSI